MEIRGPDHYNGDTFDRDLRTPFIVANQVQRYDHKPIKGLELDVEVFGIS